MLALFYGVGISSIFFVGSSKALSQGCVICPLFLCPGATATTRTVTVYRTNKKAGRACRRTLSYVSVILIPNGITSPE